MKTLVLTVLLGFSLNALATGMFCKTSATVYDRVKKTTVSTNAELIASYGKFYGSGIEVSTNTKTFCDHSYFTASTASKTVIRRNFRCGKRARYKVTPNRTASFLECAKSML